VQNLSPAKTAQTFEPPASLLVSWAAAPPRPLKVFLYSHDTFGLGHLRRNLAIARALLAAKRQFSVLLLTGSPVIGQWNLPAELRVQPLPPVVKTGAERYESHEKGKLFGMVKGYREALILKLVLQEQPDVLLVDHAPAGMNGELLSTLALLREELPATRVMLGLRDILDSPAKVREIWREQGIHALLAHAYDDILVYGSKAHFDVVENYAMGPDVAGKIRYCGHVVAESAGAHDAAPAAPCWDVARAGQRPVVLVTAGGGGDGFALMRDYLTAAKTMPVQQRYSVIVNGPLMAPHERALLQGLAAGRDDVELIAYTTDLVPSLRAAALVVAMAGYNTCAEIIAERKTAILVPRAAPREEQLLRARLLAELGLVRMIEPGADLARQLAVAVPTMLARPALPETIWEKLDLDGAARVASFLTTTARSETVLAAQGAIL
jgi:predicted glycosyltransferase